MKERNVTRCDALPTKESDLKELAALGAWCTPEFLIRSTQIAQSTHRIADAPHGAPSTSAGRYLATREMLASPGQIERAITELRQRAASPCDDGEGEERGELLDAWMAVEGCLADREHRELRAAVLERLFPHSKPATLSRSGSAVAGGH